MSGLLLVKGCNMTPDDLHRSKSGFTLIELSIVLVIIGLISAGILVGQDLIRASKLRKVITDVQTYHTAVNAFRNKYGGIPGDISDATAFFPDAVDGNDDGYVGTGNLMTDLEPYQAWYQLGEAKMIPGTYSGKRENRYYLFGVNAPESGITGTQGMAGYTFAYIDEFDLIYAYQNNVTTLGWAGGNGNTPSGGGSALTGRDAQFIDGKIDDGRMTTGRVLGENGHDNDTEYLGCAEGNASIATYDPAAPFDYDLQTDKIACTMYFMY